MSRSFVASHFPTSPIMPIGFLALCFPFIPALPLFSLLSLACPFQFPFVSLSVPAAFLSSRLPISSPHFLALPCVFLLLPIFPTKTRFSSIFAVRTSKNTDFSRFSAKGGRNPKPAKSGQGGIEPGTPVLRPAPRRLRLVERHQLPRGVWGRGLRPA